MPLPLPLALDFAPWMLSGNVVGALLNDPATLAALGDAVEQPPYRSAPRAPVLQVKPRHTFNAEGGVFELDGATGQAEIGATLGLVVGRTAHRVSVEDAASHVAGWVLVADLRLPLDSHYRPGVRRAARDGSCFLGPAVALQALPDPAAVTLTVRLGDQPTFTLDLAGLVRPWDRLLAEVSEFMTLQPGDLLLMGTRHGAPRGRAGESFTLEAGPFGALSGRLVAPRPDHPCAPPTGGVT